MAKKHVLVVGATGVSGAAFLSHIENLRQQQGCDWVITGLSRNPPVAIKGTSTHYVAADLLLDNTAIKELAPISHVVFCGFVPAPDFAGQVQPNREMLVNCLDALQSHPVEKLVLLQGMKYYGSHLGPFKTPAREDDPRHKGANYYHAQQDVLEASGINWVCLRPHVICGTHSIGTPQNILGVIGVYAALQKKLGNPLDWPGTEEAFHCINQATDASLLARAITWALTETKATNEAYNITNGDFFRWQNLWPKIAEVFDMPCGRVVPQDLGASMPALSDDWRELVVQYQLADYAMSQVASWQFADYIFSVGWDVMASTVKARLHGFQDCLDTEKMYVDHLSELQQLNILPG